MKFIHIFNLVTFCGITIPINSFPQARNQNKHPIIFIPGDGGSQAFARLTNGDSNYFPVWLDLKVLFTTGILTNYFSLVYDKNTRTTSNKKFVDVSFPGWGETWSIENLDSNPHFFTTYFGPLINAIKRDPYYVSNKTIRGAPYDFRKGLYENGEVLVKLKGLLEETYEINGKQRVVLLGHSLGCLYLLAFLQAQTASWKKKYVNSAIFVSCPLGGTLKAMKTEASGDNVGLFLQHPLAFRTVQRSMPSSTLLLPDPRIYPPNETLISTPTRNYSAHDYKQFFQDINYPEGYEMYIDNRRIFESLQAPTDVDEVYCIHGVNTCTTVQAIYLPPGLFRKAFPDQVPVMIPGEGDGTVDNRSLELCRKWPGVQHITFTYAEHKSILADSRFIQFMLTYLNVK